MRKITVLLALLALVVPAHALATVSGVNGKIAFVSTRGADGNADIWAIETDGSNPTQLTDTTADEFHPAWSPRGNRIAFCSNRDSADSIAYDIYLMDADGSNVTRLTHKPANECDVAWAPGGRRLVFASSRSGNPDLYLINRDGSGLKRLTKTQADETAPDWAPNGKWIAYVRNGAIWKMRPDGTHRTPVVKTPTSVAWSPSWSPDSGRIAYEDDRDTGEVSPSSEIWVVRADGTNRKRLTSNGVDDVQPSWSPDGSLIAYSSVSAAGYAQIWVMATNGTGKAALTTTDQGFAPGDFMPAWQSLHLLPA